MPPELLVGIETADDAAVYQLNDEQALIATTDFFMPIVDDPFDFGRIAATNAISDVYAMGGKPIMALALVGMPIDVLPLETIGAHPRGRRGGLRARPASRSPAATRSIRSSRSTASSCSAWCIPKRVKRNADARAGDVLVLGKPLGVGVLSAALKKDALDAAGYAQMIATTTQLNTPGHRARRARRRACADRRHRLRPRRPRARAGARRRLRVRDRLVDACRCCRGVRELAARGFVTGASGRNWAGYGATCDAATASMRRPGAADRPADERRAARVVRARGGRCGDRRLPPPRLRPTPPSSAR